MVDNWITYTTSNEKQHHVLRILAFQQWKVPQKTCVFGAEFSHFSDPSIEEICISKHCHKHMASSQLLAV